MTLPYNETYFDILNGLGVAYKCEKQTDGQTEWSYTISRRLRTRAKNESV